MHIISRKKLLEFCRTHADSLTPLDDWFRIAKSAKWRHIDDVRQIYSSADAVGKFTIFNIKGNDYRLIVSIDYDSQTIFVKYILTHAEYNKEKWKNAPYF